jgi:hypothetical protein
MDKFSPGFSREDLALMDGAIFKKGMQHWLRKAALSEHWVDQTFKTASTRFVRDFSFWALGHGSKLNRELNVVTGYSERYALDALAAIASALLSTGNLAMFCSASALLNLVGLQSNGAAEKRDYVAECSIGSRTARLCHVVLAFRFAYACRGISVEKGIAAAGLARLKGGIGMFSVCSKYIACSLLTHAFVADSAFLKQGHLRSLSTLDARKARTAQMKPWPEVWANQAGVTASSLARLLTTVNSDGRATAGTRTAVWEFENDMVTELSTQNGSARPVNLASYLVRDVRARKDTGGTLHQIDIDEWGGKGHQNRHLRHASPLSGSGPAQPHGCYKVVDPECVVHFGMWLGKTVLGMPSAEPWPALKSLSPLAAAHLSKVGLRSLMLSGAPDSGHVLLAYNGEGPINRSSLFVQLKQRTGVAPRFVRRAQSSHIADVLVEDAAGGLSTGGASHAFADLVSHLSSTSLANYVHHQQEQVRGATALAAVRRSVSGAAHALVETRNNAAAPSETMVTQRVVAAASSVLPLMSERLQTEPLAGGYEPMPSSHDIDADDFSNASDNGSEMPQPNGSLEHNQQRRRAARNTIKFHPQAASCGTCGTVFSDKKALLKHQTLSARTCQARRELAGDRLAEIIAAGDKAAHMQRMEARAQKLK